jgi:enamine deaminase RidA (YjgF/YER057c/UK114 family)
VNHKPADYPIISDVRARIFEGQNLPASTLIGVQALAVEELLIEIEAIASVE